MAHLLRQSRINATAVVVLIAAAAVCWAVSVGQMDAMGASAGKVTTGMHMSMGTGMSMGRGLRTNLGSLGGFIGIWPAMMAAMMLPSVIPAATAADRVQSAHRSSAGAGAVAEAVGFAAGYIVVWSATGLLAYGVIRALHPLVPQWDQGGRYIAAAVLLGAAGFELSPLKANCLRMCRDWSPAAQHIRAKAGVIGAIVGGVEHSWVCIGCCWALMAALFALGVMKIGWMVVIAGVIAIQKLLPERDVWRWGAAALLASLSVAAAL